MFSVINCEIRDVVKVEESTHKLNNEEEKKNGKISRCENNGKFSIKEIKANVFLK